LLDHLKNVEEINHKKPVIQKGLLLK